MDYSEKWGTSIEEAVKLALEDMKLTKEEVEVIVLEQPSKGFFGIGSKLAKVRVEKKAIQPEIEPEVKRETKKPKAKREELKEEPKKAEKKIKPEREERHSKNKKTKEILKIEEEVVPVEDHIAIDFLDEMTKKMSLDLKITAKEGENTIYLSIEGKDAGTVIGKRGQTLDAIQYLTSLVVNKENEKYMRVVVDAENYRSKREKTLQQLADRLAAKVIKNKRSVRLEPMNPYERKVIHATLQSNPKVTTRSEGDEPYRRVIIELR